MAIRRLRKVRGAPETLEEKVAYAKMACAKDNANECLMLLDSIRILDSMLIALSPEAAQPLPDDSLQKRLPPSSLDMATRINLWEKRAVTLRTLKRDKAVPILAGFRGSTPAVDAVDIAPVPQQCPALRQGNP